jgi:branched-chain amino acid transport system ATP-binding protein
LANPLLEVRDLSVSYGDVRALSGASLSVQEDTIVALVGVNGAGKTTLLNAISGLLPRSRGSILFEGQELKKLTMKQRVELGIVQVPEGRRLFADLTIYENLRLGAYLPKARAALSDSLERVYGLFPVLKDREHGKAGLLSGGEQQMLAIGRALMAQPRLVMIDEASLGLSPKLTRQIFELIDVLHQQGTTVLLVEQNIHMALKISDRGYVFQNGRVVMSGTGEELLADEDVRTAYLGQRGSRVV